MIQPVDEALDNIHLDTWEMESASPTLLEPVAKGSREPWRNVYQECAHDLVLLFVVVDGDRDDVVCFLEHAVAIDQSCSRVLAWRR